MAPSAGNRRIGMECPLIPILLDEMTQEDGEVVAIFTMGMTIEEARLEARVRRSSRDLVVTTLRGHGCPRTHGCPMDRPGWPDGHVYKCRAMPVPLWPWGEWDGWSKGPGWSAGSSGEP
jgi:hypothetical protein